MKPLGSISSTKGGEKEEKAVHIMDRWLNILLSENRNLYDTELKFHFYKQK
jgi:hypothetical protein